MDKKFILVGLLLISLLANATLSFFLVQNNQALDKMLHVQQANAKIIEFTHVFIEEVLLASQDVDFDTRLSLETMVRNLNDQEILDQWQEFTGAQTQEQASIRAKRLLNLLVNKVSF
jgi:hypothetical protein